jgi:cell wall-associated NlpC family hydrolase
MAKIHIRAASLVATLALGAGTAFSTGLPANAAMTCQITFKSYVPVRAGSYGLQAKAAQCLLKSAGYPNTIRLRFSAADASKLKKFQASRRLSATGVVTGKTWTALLSRGTRPLLQTGSSGAAVKRLQRSLTASGRPVPVTGYFGSVTAGAVKSVQRSQGWTATGRATNGVWRVLQYGIAAKATATAAKTTTTTASKTKGQIALAYAKKQIGDPYRYGGTGPFAWDCSGLTQAAWRAAGVSLPHSSRAQFRYGKSVAKSNLRAGDLVFFYSPISHVGLYAGNGLLLHASRPGKPVGYIKMSYMPYAGARRPG